MDNLHVSNSSETKDCRSKEVVLKGAAVNVLYQLHLDDLALVEAHLGENASFSLWHRRLGHVHEQGTRRIISTFDLPVGNNKMDKCNSCVLGKMHKLPSPSRDVNSATSSLKVYADVWGLAPMSSIDGFCYYINFVDGFSRFNWLFPITRKSDALHTFIKFRTLIEK